MASKNSDSITIQKNGYIVMDALHAFNVPVTLQSLIKHIAKIHNLKSDRIREPIKTVLQTGLDNGFLERHQGKYSICGLNNYQDNYDDHDNYDGNNYVQRSDSDELEPCYPPKKRRRIQSSKPHPPCRKPRRKRFQ